MTKMKKCVDDVLGWAKTLVELFFDTAYFLYYTNTHGVIQNPLKFVWGKKVVEYLGFTLTQDGVQPSQETLKAITEFPRPKDITGVRSWFGLIEQVSFAFAKTTLMEPFRKLLGKNVIFAWDQQLQDAFQLAKQEIVQLVAKGVKSYSLDLPTCIVSDWSQQGLGFALWQKKCTCQLNHPSCCKDGWALVTCGSRFCTAAESRYHPIEGELLALTLALEKTAYFTLGCPNLLALVDHKPLIGLLTTRNLGDIENPRPLHLAERLLKWNFKIEHVAGATNYTPDALSRYPVPGNTPQLNMISNSDQFNSDKLEAQVLATSANRRQLVVSWDMIQTAAISDDKYSTLLQHLHSDTSTWPEVISDYKRFASDFSEVDGVVLHRGRIVVPAVLREQVLRSLHRAHQGSSGMVLRSHDSVWWPGITDDIANTRNSCQTCIQNAPSQSPMPPYPPPNPRYPFQLVSSDYFYYNGYNYLVLVDRYSNWPVVKRCKEESSSELISSLREYFCTYGVPDQLATDGGSTYVSDQTQAFLATWGVEHRVSSSYHPHSNLRAETAVKTIKRLIKDNTGPLGSLDNDSLAAALLLYRNTPDKDTKRSPAQILFARNLKDTIPCTPENLSLRKEWVLTAEERQKALAQRHLSRHTDLAAKTKELKPLAVGDSVQIQNQKGQHAKKWDFSGVIVEKLDYDAYLVKLDGTGRVSKRNRQFLRLIIPFHANNSNPNLHNTDPTAVSREATTPVTPSRLHSQPTAQPTAAKFSEPDTLPQCDPMSDEDFNKGLLKAAKNVSTIPQQKEGTRPEATRSNRVRFATKRFIEQY